MREQAFQAITKPSHNYTAFISEKGKPLPPLLPWRSAEKMVPWGVVLLLGGGFALAKGSEVHVLRICQESGSCQGSGS